ncbi:MAG TPA: alpha-ketoglutarate-dependent dioxygenase AlkB [Vicinamibacterales bacterium]|nr:alpha-ketoglutarate-dependent dioxygenase AlkB [Vicinamibacterales bacterium]
MEIAPGAFHLRRYLSLDAQRALADDCRALVDGPVPAYVPVVRGGGKMHVRMLCLGRHWNGKTYRYEPVRGDFDGLPAPPLPDAFKALARDAAAAAGMSLDADLCILNYYDAGGRMGLHQDKDESPASIAAGVPVVSISIGDAGGFCLGDRNAAIRSRRGCSNRAMRSCSAGRPGCATTAFRESFPTADLRNSG